MTPKKTKKDIKIIGSDLGLNECISYEAPCCPYCYKAQDRVSHIFQKKQEIKLGCWKCKKIFYCKAKIVLEFTTEEYWD